MVEEEPEDIQEPVTDNKDKEEDKKEKPNGDNEEKEPKNMKLTRQRNIIG